MSTLQESAGLGGLPLIYCDLSTRAFNVCKALKCATAEDVATCFERGGVRPFLFARNSGRKTSCEIACFVEALRNEQRYVEPPRTFSVKTFTPEEALLALKIMNIPATLPSDFMRLPWNKLPWRPDLRGHTVGDFLLRASVAGAGKPFRFDSRHVEARVIMGKFLRALAQGDRCTLRRFIPIRLKPVCFSIASTLNTFSASLDARERALLSALLAKRMNYAATGREVGLTGMRVSQLHKALMHRVSVILSCFELDTEAMFHLWSGKKGVAGYLAQHQIRDPDHVIALAIEQVFADEDSI